MEFILVILDFLDTGGIGYVLALGDCSDFHVMDVMVVEAVVLVEETTITPTPTKILTFGCAGSSPAKGINMNPAYLSQGLHWIPWNSRRHALHKKWSLDRYQTDFDAPLTITWHG